MRFANRVPLTFDAGSCAITEALKSTRGWSNQLGVMERKENKEDD